MEDKVIKLGRYIKVGDTAFHSNPELLVDIKVKAGYYVCWAEDEDFGYGWGVRTGRLSAYHNKFLQRLEQGSTDYHYEKFGYFGVDTGTAGIWNENESAFCWVDGEENLNAVWCRSGMGDGYYPVSVCIEKNQVVGIVIDFTFDEEEEKKVEKDLAE